MTKPKRKHGAPQYSPEGGGVVVTCVCGWLRWQPDRKRAGEAYKDHHKPKED